MSSGIPWHIFIESRVNIRRCNLGRNRFPAIRIQDKIRICQRDITTIRIQHQTEPTQSIPSTFICRQLPTQCMNFSIQRHRDLIQLQMSRTSFCTAHKEFSLHPTSFRIVNFDINFKRSICRYIFSIIPCSHLFPACW